MPSTRSGSKAVEIRACGWCGRGRIDQQCPSESALDPTPEWHNRWVADGADVRREILAAPLAASELGGPSDDFVMVEWSDSGHGESKWIAPLHVHHKDDEAWYVLEGSLRFQLGDQEVEAGPGTAVLAPRGMPHSYGNARDELARYLLVMTPKIRALVEELHAPRQGNEPLDYPAIFRKYDSELLT